MLGMKAIIINTHTLLIPFDIIVVIPQQFIGLAQQPDMFIKASGAKDPALAMFGGVRACPCLFLNKPQPNIMSFFAGTCRVHWKVRQKRRQKRRPMIIDGK